VTRWCKWITRLKSTLVSFASLVKPKLWIDQLVGYFLEFKNLFFLYMKGTMQNSFSNSDHNLRNVYQLTMNYECIFWDPHENMFCLNSWWFELEIFVKKFACFRLWHTWLWYWSIFQLVLDCSSLIKRTYDDPTNKLKWCFLPILLFNNSTLV
jgi:hypothetical protein